MRIYGRGEETGMKIAELARQRGFERLYEILTADHKTVFDLAAHMDEILSYPEMQELEKEHSSTGWMFALYRAIEVLKQDTSKSDGAAV